MHESTRSISAEALDRFIVDILLRSGAPDDIAQAVAWSLVEADLRGHSSHGVARLPLFVARIRSGAHDPQARPEILTTSRNTAVVDAANGFGQFAAKVAVELVVQKAINADVGVVVIRRMQNCGMLSIYVEEIAARSMIGVMCTNGAPAVGPVPTSRPILGTNPLAISFPFIEPITLDMSTTVVARDKIMMALREGRKIPMEWALDSEGQPTADPAEALKGSLRPLGEHKGFGLAVAVEVLAGVLSGAAIAMDVGWLYSTDRAQDSGCWVGALRVGAFMAEDEFRSKLLKLRAAVKSSSGEGPGTVYLPGEIERRTRTIRAREGIPLHGTTVEALHRLAEEVGVSGLW